MGFFDTPFKKLIKEVGEELVKKLGTETAEQAAKKIGARTLNALATEITALGADGAEKVAKLLNNTTPEALNLLIKKKGIKEVAELTFKDGPKVVGKAADEVLEIYEKSFRGKATDFLWSGGTKRKVATSIVGGTVVAGLVADNVPEGDTIVGGAMAAPGLVIGGLGKSTGEGLEKAAKKMKEITKSFQEKDVATSPKTPSLNQSAPSADPVDPNKPGESQYSGPGALLFGGLGGLIGMVVAWLSGGSASTVAMVAAGAAAFSAAGGAIMGGKVLEDSPKVADTTTPQGQKQASGNGVSQQQQPQASYHYEVEQNPNAGLPTNPNPLGKAAATAPSVG